MWRKQNLNPDSQTGVSSLGLDHRRQCARVDHSPDIGTTAIRYTYGLLPKKTLVFTRQVCEITAPRGEAIHFRWDVRGRRRWFRRRSDTGDDPTRKQDNSTSSSSSSISSSNGRNDLLAHTMLRMCQNKLAEKPHDTEWNELAALKVPLLLNYSQCKLLERDYYAVIEHCSEVLDKYEPDSVKALFRRAKAHVGAWNPTRARDDFERAATLDPALAPAVAKELRQLQDQIRAKDDQDRRTFRRMF